MASADALTKKFFANYSGRQLVTIRFGVPALILLPVAYLNPLPPVPAIFWFWVATLVPFEILAMWLYMVAIRDSPLHLTLPYLAFTPFFNIATGYLILGESITFQGFIGIMLVVIGAYWLNIDHSNSLTFNSWAAPFKAIYRQRGSRFMLGVALIYSFNSVIGKHVMLYATPVSFGPFYFILIGSVLVVFSLIRHPGDLPKLFSEWPKLLTVGALMAIMIISHFIAIAHLEVAYFISLKRLSLLFGIMYGALLFGEQKLGRHLLAGSLMVAGMAIIILS